MPLEYRDVRGLEARTQRCISATWRIGSEKREFGYTLAVQVMFVCIAAAVYGVPRLRTEWFWALFDNDAADAIDSTLSDELEVESWWAWRGGNTRTAAWHAAVDPCVNLRLLCERGNDDRNRFRRTAQPELHTARPEILLES